MMINTTATACRPLFLLMGVLCGSLWAARGDATLVGWMPTQIKGPMDALATQVLSAGFDPAADVTGLPSVVVYQHQKDALMPAMLVPSDASSAPKTVQAANLDNGVEQFFIELAKGAVCDDANVFWVQDDFHFMIDHRCRALEWAVPPPRAFVARPADATPAPAAPSTAPIATALPASAAGRDSQEKQKTSILDFGVVNTEQNSLNIRSGAGKQYDVIGKAARGAKVVILEDAGQWLKIRLADGTIGYAAKEHIKPNPDRTETPKDVGRS
jgi:hypothetical protein